MWKCPECRQQNQDDYEECWNCAISRPANLAATLNPAKSNSEATRMDHNPAPTFTKITAMNRYHDLYRAAKLLILMGNIVKAIGVILGIVIFFPTLRSNNPEFSTGLPALGLIGALVIGGVILIFGILIAAQGQLLLAQADIAIYASPFLSNQEKAETIAKSL